MPVSVAPSPAEIVCGATLRELRKASAGMSQNQWAVRLALAADREGITYVGQTTSQQKWSVAKATVQRWESGQATPDEVAEQAIVALCRECKAFDARASESESEEDAPITESRLHDVLVEARRAAFRRRHGDGASDSTGEEPDTTGEGNAIPPRHSEEHTEATPRVMQVVVFGVLAVALVFIALWIVATRGASAPTVPPDQPAPKSFGTVVSSDQFDDPPRGVLPERSPDSTFYRRGYVDGHYEVAKVNAQRPGGYGARLERGAHTYFDDVSVSIDSLFVDGPTSTSMYVEIGCRHGDSSGWYALRLKPDSGAVALYMSKAGEHMMLTPWQESGYVKRGKGQVNRLWLTCDGPHISGGVVVDGTAVSLAAAVDDTRRGGVVFLEVDSGSSAATFYFDDLIVTVP